MRGLRWALYLAVGVLGVGCDVGGFEVVDRPGGERRPEARLVRVAEGFTHPVQVTSAPGSDALWVADQIGTLWRLDEEDGRTMRELVLDLRPRMVQLMEDYDERGLLGVAFHPLFDRNGRLYVHYSAPLREGAPTGYDHTSTISEFVMGDDGLVDLSSERILLEVDQPQFNGNGGGIAFGPEGYLYIALGDGGGANDEGLGHTPLLGNGQDLGKLLGKILRIDVDAREEPYGIPASNPFAGALLGREEIFAWGFRNPYRFSFDGADLLVADAGQDLYEEISRIRLGDNAGWPIREGRHCFSRTTPTDPPATCNDVGAMGEPLIDPVIEYPHPRAVPGGYEPGDVAGIVTVGGHLYRGDDVPALAGRFVFGDLSAREDLPEGHLWVATPRDDGQAWEPRRLRLQGVEDHLGAYLLGIGQDADGELYPMTTEEIGPVGSTGVIWRLAAPGDDDDEPTPSVIGVDLDDVIGPPPIAP